MSQTPLDEIRRLYFETTKQTLLDDFDRAIDLLKSIETPEARAKATVYMSGLAEMRKEWGLHKGAAKRPRSGRPRPKSKKKS